MGIAEYFSIAILSIIWITSFSAFRREGRFPLPALAPQSGAKVGFALAIIGVIIIQCYYTRAQFLLWQGNEISTYLIPPYQSMRYFLFYVGTRFWAPYLVSGVVGLLGFLGARYANKKFGERFFENEEPQYFALGIFLASHPGWTFYLAIICIVYFLYAIILNVKRCIPNPKPYILNAQRRVSFYYWWLPLAALAIIANAYLSGLNWYGNLII